MSGLRMFLIGLCAISGLILDSYAIFKDYGEYKRHKEKNDDDVDRSILLIICRLVYAVGMIFVLIILYTMIK